MVFTKNQEEIARVRICYKPTEIVKLPWNAEVQNVPWVKFKQGRSFSQIVEMDWLRVEMPPLNHVFGFYLMERVYGKERLDEALCIALVADLKRKELEVG